MRGWEIFFGLIVVLGIASGGCLGSQPQAPTVTPTPQIIYVTVTVTPAETPVTTAPVAVTTTPQASVLFHRWVNTTGSFQAENWQGMELRFYPSGFVSLNNGTMKEVSSNIVLDKVNQQWVGKWIAAGPDIYIVRLTLSGTTDENPLVYVVRYYPESSDPRYPGLASPERVEFDKTLFFRGKID